MKTWKEILIEAFNELGGYSDYKALYEYLENNVEPIKLAKTWQNTVRRTIQNYSSDSNAYSNSEDIFYSVDGIGGGVWGLRDNYLEIKKDVLIDNYEFPEGKKLFKEHTSRERNSTLISIAKDKFKEKNGSLYCEVCGFNFEKVYGEIGSDYIEAHHTKPISEYSDNERTTIKDLLMVCSNCHKMIHRKRPWLSKSEIKNLIISKK